MTTNTGVDVFMKFLKMFDFKKSDFDTDMDGSLFYLKDKIKEYQYKDFELDHCVGEFIQDAVMLILLNIGDENYLKQLKDKFPNNETSQDDVMYYIIESHGFRECKEHFYVFKITEKNREFFISRCSQCISNYMENE
jgi:hypothetical protein